MNFHFYLYRENSWRFVCCSSKLQNSNLNLIVLFDLQESSNREFGCGDFALIFTKTGQQVIVSILLCQFQRWHFEEMLGSQIVPFVSSNCPLAQVWIILKSDIQEIGEKNQFYWRGFGSLPNIQWTQCRAMFRGILFNTCIFMKSR